LKVAITIAVPCPQTDLSSLMPSTVFTTSSIGCAMSDSTSSGAAPEDQHERNCGQVNGRKTIDAKPEETSRAHHDQRQHDHRRENRTANTDFG
jgi:hypothetical protein